MARQEKQWASRQDEKRPVYQSPAWDALREDVVTRDGYQCQECARNNRFTVVALHAKRGTGQLMAIVDHIVPAVTAEDVLCDPSNLETLCPSCASRKTARRDGGFGNRVKHG